MSPERYAVLDRESGSLGIGTYFFPARVPVKVDPAFETGKHKDLKVFDSADEAESFLSKKPEKKKSPTQ